MLPPQFPNGQPLLASAFERIDHLHMPDPDHDEYDKGFNAAIDRSLTVLVTLAREQITIQSMSLSEHLEHHLAAAKHAMRYFNDS